MKTDRTKSSRDGLIALLLITAGLTLAGCADEYVAYPRYGGYYAAYAPYRPYYAGYGYGYGPYRSYGPYYGAPYAPYYGSGATVVVSGNRNYVYRDGTRRSYYRYDRTRSQKATRHVTKRTQKVLNPGDQDDERRYYQSR